MEPLRSLANPAMNRFELRARAFQLVKEHSFFRKQMLLASGQESSFYFDMKPSMLHPEGAHLLAELVFERLSDLDVDLVGGLQMGAVPLIGPICLLSFAKGRPIAGFFVRSQIKDHGTMKLIEGAGDLAGKNVVILEDVTTTGGSAMKALTAARNAGANILLVLSIVDREEGAAEFYARENIRFDAIFRASEFLHAN